MLSGDYHVMTPIQEQYPTSKNIAESSGYYGKPMV